MALAIAIQTYGSAIKPGDLPAAVELTKLLADIEDNYRSDVFFMMMFRKDCPADRQAVCVQNLREKFPAQGFIARNFGKDWPLGPNMLWISTMTQVQGMFNEHKKNPKMGIFPYNGVATIEPDVVPLRKDWITALTQEWNTRVIAAGEWTPQEEDAAKNRIAGRPKYEVMGHFESDHVNGNFVIRPDFQDRYGVIRYSTSDAWDTANGDLFMRLGVDTNLICQNYHRRHITREEIVTPYGEELLTKNGVVPALFHGLQEKVGVLGRKFVREKLVDGVLV